MQTEHVFLPGLSQDITAAEEEAARKRVGATAAGKQLEKLRREVAKTEADAAKVDADLAERRAEAKARLRLLYCPAHSRGRTPHHAAELA
jgi:hypothetical protein